MEPIQFAAVVGGVTGSIVGLIGGGIGTYFSIKNVNGPRERAFVIRCAVICWAAIVGFLAAYFLLPRPWQMLLWIPYSVLLPLSIRKWNAEHARIRSEETIITPQGKSGQ